MPYCGAAPLAKGWNAKRRHAQPGRDDTYVTDLAGRALCFTSSEPSGLSMTMRAAATELRRLRRDRPLTLAFERGGSYPVAVSWLRDQGVTWLTSPWRPGPRGDRAPAVLVRPRRAPPRLPGGRRGAHLVRLRAGPPGHAVRGGPGGGPGPHLRHDLDPAHLVHLLRCRWRIENAFKCLGAHHGIDWLGDYRMETVADQRRVANPERVAARAAWRALHDELAATEGPSATRWPRPRARTPWWPSSATSVSTGP